MPGPEDTNDGAGGASRPLFQRRKILIGIGAAVVATAGAGVWTRRLWFERHYTRPRFNSVQAVSYPVTSPNERWHAELLFEAAGGAAPRWRVQHDDRTVLEPESLGLTLADGRRLGPGVQVIGQQFVALHEHLPLGEGQAANLSGECNELAVQMMDAAAGIIFDIIVRAYDTGVAQGYLLRYMPDNEAMQPFTTPWRVVLADQK